jgi:hypothetical protein
MQQHRKWVVPVVRRKPMLTIVKDYIYYKYWFSVGYYLQRIGKLAGMALKNETETYFVYDKNIIINLTWRNYYAYMSVDLGETALLKFKNKQGKYVAYQAEYFGNKIVKNNSMKLSNLMRPVN